MLRIAIQAKGRLNEDTTALLREIGIRFDDSKRKFLCTADNFPVEMLYMRDDDIPLVVSNGTAGLGIVGLNEVAEKGFDVDIVERLGFGMCRISLAIPKTAEYNGLQWFNGRRIATSYPAILKKFLDENGLKADIEVITGSVEIAPAAGIADAIFDIVSSGGTLVSNGLVEVEKVFYAEAVLIANKSLTEDEKALLEELLFRIRSAKISRGRKYLMMNVPRQSLDEALRILPAMRSPTILPLADENWCSLHSVVDTAELWDKVRQLKAIGAEGILVLDIDKIIP